MLCQVPTTSGSGADSGHSGPKGTNIISRAHRQLTDQKQRPDHSDISLALTSRDHPLIPYPNLEAEGHGLLDRLLDVIHGDHRSDASKKSGGASLTSCSDGLLITGTLNSLGVLMHRRPIAVNKILNSVLSFNPIKLANSPLTPKNKVIIKSIERTTRALLVNIVRRYVPASAPPQCCLTRDNRNPENQLSGRINQFIERMSRARHEALDESSRKRPAPSEPTDGMEQAKRQRVGADTTRRQQPVVPPLPEGNVSLRDLFTLNPDASIVNFDVQAFQDPEQLLRILVPILQSVDAQSLDHAINVRTAQIFALRLPLLRPSCIAQSILVTS